MNNNENVRQGMRPPPPPPPRFHEPSNNQIPGDRPNGLQNIFRITIIVLTCIGIFFAIRAISKKINEEQTPSSQANVSAGASGAMESLPTNINANVSSPSTNTSTLPANNGEASISVKQTDKPIVQVDSLNIDLGNIEHKFDTELAMPDTSVYQRIAYALKESIKVQMSLLKHSGATDPEVTSCNKIQNLMEIVEKHEDPPYYSGATAAYSRLLAEATVAFASKLGSESSKQTLADKLLSIRESSLEGTCDATYVTGCALAVIGRAGTQITQGSEPWDQLESAIGVEIKGERHIILKNESLHSKLCAILEGCVRAWDRQSLNSHRITEIVSDKQKAINEGSNSFIRIAAYTEAELRLMILMARSLEP